MVVLLKYKEEQSVWIPNLFNEFEAVYVYENEDDDSPRIFKSTYVVLP